MTINDDLFYRWVLLGVLLTFSAFFAGAEVALFSLSRMQIDRLKKRSGKYGAKIEELLATPQRLLVTIYIGNELANVAISAVTTIIALDMFGNKGLAIAIGVGAFLLLVFGEISPKTFAHHHNERLAVIAAYPMFVFMTFITPLQAVVTAIANIAVRILGGEPTMERTILTEDEVRSMVETGADEGVIDREEQEMIQSVFELGDVTVAEIMTPRTDIIALDIDSDMKIAWDEMLKAPFARAPLYRGSIDRIEGILFKKDLLKLSYPPSPEIKLSSLARKPFIVPETMTINELLREFKRRKTHIAIAMDEYGGVNGIATLDDIIRELVGDSSTNGAETIVKTGEGRYRVDALCEIEEFNDFFHTTILHEDIETIGGYIFHLFGEPPQIGSSIDDGGLRYKVTNINGPRITELAVLQLDAPLATGGGA